MDEMVMIVVNEEKWKEVMFGENGIEDKMKKGEEVMV